MKSGTVSNTDDILNQEENQDVSKTDKGGTNGCICVPTKVYSSVKDNIIDIDDEDSDEIHSSETSDNKTEEDQNAFSEKVRNNTMDVDDEESDESYSSETSYNKTEEHRRLTIDYQ